ncbi:hypothetical protein BG004_001915 [Podila humilis]|nr:hypothetical protein BG004_001915 [Podila humilis]
MLAGDRPQLPKAGSRYSFHAEPTIASSCSNPGNGAKTFPKRRLTRQLSSSLMGSFVHGLHGSSQASAALPLSASSHPRHHSISGSTRLSSSSPESAAVSKEKEFMANTRILAMSNIIDTFTSTQSKQGFYGKQLKILGKTTTPSSASPITTSGADLDIIVKVSVLILLQHNGGPVMSTQDQEHSWIHASTVATTISSERAEISPASSPKFEHPPQPYSSNSSVSGQSSGLPTTHVAVLASALCFVTNKAGDYLVMLSVHVPFTTLSSCKSVHLPQIPKCQRNFIRLSIRDQGESEERGSGANENENKHQLQGLDGLEFNVHPPLVSPDEAHLNPESDEDALFWEEVQAHILGSIDGDRDFERTEELAEEAQPKGTENESGLSETTIAGCFAPTSALHVSWMPMNTTCLIQKVDQDTTVHISGLPNQTKSSSLLKDRKRKDPEDSHLGNRQDPDDEPIEYEHLEMDDADFVITAETILSVVIEKRGWKRPFIDLTLEHATFEHGQSSEISLLDISGDSVQEWELVSSDKMDERRLSLDFETTSRESPLDASRTLSVTYRVWLYMGTEGIVSFQVNYCVSQPVSVGYGRDMTCSIPRIQVQGTQQSTGRVHVSSSNDLLIQRSNTRQMETILADSPLYRDDAMVNRRQGTLQYQYSSADYDLSVVVHRYKTLSRIARIERIRVEVGISARRQPGFARVTLSDVVLPEQDDSFLRIYQLEGAEIWSISVDGAPCSKSVQLVDKKVSSNRTVLIPIPIASGLDLDQPHTIEISYGFDSVDRDFVRDGEHMDNDDDSEGVYDAPIRLLVPGFNLPVGEYIVVANLPKLARGHEYDAPEGDFEVVSSKGTPSQRRSITYGAYMTLGHPKLLIRTQLASMPPPPQAIESQPPHPQPAAIATQPEPMEQITRAQGHPNMYAHDPQQPPFSAGPIHLHPSSQRHPQQSLELHNPQADNANVDNNDLLATGTGLATGSNLSPQIGSPIQQARLSFISHDISLEPLSITKTMAFCRLWWKQIMAPMAAILLVIMIINVAAFQETGNTSLSLVRFAPVWMRPFKVIGQLWRDSSSSSSSSSSSTAGSSSRQFISMDDEDRQDFPPTDYRATGTQPVFFKSVTTTVASNPIPIDKGLEVRQPDSKIEEGSFGENDGGNEHGSEYDEYVGVDGGGWQQWVRFLKGIVQGLKPA